MRRSPLSVLLAVLQGKLRPAPPGPTASRCTGELRARARPSRAAGRWRACVGCAAAALSGCASFDRSLVEFDSVTRRDQSREEPDQVRYRVRPYSYSTIDTMLDWVGSWLVGIVGSVPPVDERRIDVPPPKPAAEGEAPDTSGLVQNPALIARDWLDCLVAKSAGNRHKTALVANRLLWLLAYDVYPQTILASVRSVESILRRTGRDPALVPLQPAGDQAEGERIRGLMEELARLDLARRGSGASSAAGSLSGEQRARYVELLRALTRVPLSSRKAQRNLLVVLADAELAEDDPDLRGPTAEAANLALEFALVTGLRDTLGSTVTPVARAEALLAFYRLSGPRIVPVLIQWLTKPQGKHPEERYDPDADVRRTLVRLCGQMPPALALAYSEAGVPPVPALLLETITADDPSLQLLALEALARLLGHPVCFDPVSLDDHEWATQWWRRYIEERPR